MIIDNEKILNIFRINETNTLPIDTFEEFELKYINDQMLFNQQGRYYLSENQYLILGRKGVKGHQIPYAIFPDNTTAKSWVRILDIMEETGLSPTISYKTIYRYSEKTFVLIEEH